MNSRLLFTFIIGFTAVVHATDNSDEVFFEEIPDHQPHWNFVPTAPQEVDSDSKSSDDWLRMFDQASKKRLGTRRDLASIRAFVLANLREPDAEILAIRWVSSALVMVRAKRGPYDLTRLLYVIQKRHTKWQLLRRYEFFFTTGV